MSSIDINGRTIKSGEPAYIVAELSANHGGSIEHAKDVIRAMKESGADAVKLQTYTADTLTLDCDREEFRVQGTIWEGRTLHNLYHEAHTPWDWHAELFELANNLGMDCFSTPFDPTATDFLEELNPPCYKIASFEIVDLPLIEYVSSKGRPIIMSTGMANLGEISEAVDVVKKAGVDLALLKCTSAYPSPPESMNLRTIPHLAAAFDVAAGLSDHTLGIAVPVAAVAHEACIIEKHFTMSRDDPGPDSAFSLEPHEFKSLVDNVRVAERALGRVNYQLTEKEQVSKSFRRSLYAVDDLQPGEKFTSKNVRSIRPGHGLAPGLLNQVLGRTAKIFIKRGTPLSWDLIS